MQEAGWGYFGETLGSGIRVQVCGRLALVVDGQRREHELPGRQGRELLTLLVVRRHDFLTRERIVDLLWEAGAPSAADSALSALLSKLRRVVGAELLPGKPEPRLVLPADAYVDFDAAVEAIHRAESAVAGGKWTEAWGPARVALHTATRGFLPGHDAGWIEETRRTLEDLRLRGLECVAAAGLGLGGGELASVERSARALVESWPFRESGYRFLMQALEAQGNVAEAVRVYERLRCLLRDELGVPPGPELQSQHRHLLGLRLGNPEAAA